MSRDELVEAFAAFPARLAAAAKARVAEWRPFPEGEWGPIETVRHLIAVEQEVHRARLTQVARQDDPHWTWTEPGLAPGFDDASLLEVLTVFARRRAKTVATSGPSTRPAGNGTGPTRRMAASMSRGCSAWPSTTTPSTWRA